ncbi:MAG: metal ABC transporter permease [Flavobacteriales bacterium]
MIFAEDYNTLIVAFGAVLLSSVSAVTGVFAYLRKKALSGDVVAHSVLPGIILAYMATGIRNPFVLLLGALFTGGLSMRVSEWLTAKARLKEDAALAFTMSVFFAAGIFLMHFLQTSGALAQAGIQDFLFGKAAALSLEDLLWLGSAALVVLLSVILFYKPILVFAFSPSYAASAGLPVGFLSVLLSGVLVWNISISLQTTGVVMSAALMITPAAAARFWTDSLKKMFLLSAVFGATAGLAGAAVSYLAADMPTGPWIVVVLTLIAFTSFLFSPKGRVRKWWQAWSHRRTLALENVLKNIYKYLESEADPTYFMPRAVSGKYGISGEEWKKGWRQALARNLVVKGSNGYFFTEKGRSLAARVVRLHRLWELYILKYARIPEEWVHADAEHFEHFISEKIEKDLLQLLDNPETDPHQKPIPGL